MSANENAPSTIGLAQRIGRGAARIAVAVASWPADRVQDTALWLVNLLRDLPLRVARLMAGLWGGLMGLLTFLPDGIRGLRRGEIPSFTIWLWATILRGIAWLLTMLSRAADLLGIPELLEVLVRATTRATPLTGHEIAVAALILGPTAVRYGDVRVAEGGILRLVFWLNGGRAFTLFHTVNLPHSGEHRRQNRAILVHELVHVFQHERIGSLYIGQAVYAQNTVGYDYGGPEGLRRAHAEGIRFRDYNREQQAQIVQDYYTLRQQGADVEAYRPFIAELREGRV